MAKIKLHKPAMKCGEKLERRDKAGRKAKCALKKTKQTCYRLRALIFKRNENRKATGQLPNCAWRQTDWQRAYAHFWTTLHYFASCNTVGSGSIHAPPVLFIVMLFKFVFLKRVVSIQAFANWMRYSPVPGNSVILAWFSSGLNQCKIRLTQASKRVIGLNQG